MKKTTVGSKRDTLGQPCPVVIASEPSGETYASCGFEFRDGFSYEGEPLLIMLRAEDGQAYILHGMGHAAPLYLKLGVDRLLPKLQFVYF